jgi:hypothetical protein
MSKEQEDTSSPPAKDKSGIRVAQILAAALAAVTAALLGSTLGVAGTVLGAGVASVVTTVGGEVYLRSLQRTREAALRAKVAAARALTVPGGARLSRVQQQLAEQQIVHLNLAEQPTVQLPKPGEQPPPEDESATSTLRKLRWPLIVGTSVIACAVALAVLFTVNSAVSGTPSLPGRGGGGGAPASTSKNVPSTPESTPSSSQTSSDTTSPSSPTTTPSSPTTTPSSPTTTPTSPTSPTSPSAPSTTPSAPADGGPTPT